MIASRSQQSIYHMQTTADASRSSALFISWHLAFSASPNIESSRWIIRVQCHLHPRQHRERTAHPDQSDDIEATLSRAERSLLADAPKQPYSSASSTAAPTIGLRRRCASIPTASMIASYGQISGRSFARSCIRYGSVSWASRG